MAAVVDLVSPGSPSSPRRRSWRGLLPGGQPRPPRLSRARKTTWGELIDLSRGSGHIEVVVTTPASAQRVVCARWWVIDPGLMLAGGVTAEDAVRHRIEQAVRESPTLPPTGPQEIPGIGLGWQIEEVRPAGHRG
jgi:hypothetical protein